MDDVEIFTLNKMRQSVYSSITFYSTYGDIQTEVHGQTQLIVCAFKHAEPLTTRGTTLCPATI